MKSYQKLVGLFVDADLNGRDDNTGEDFTEFHDRIFFVQKNVVSGAGTAGPATAKTPTWRSQLQSEAQACILAPLAWTRPWRCRGPRETCREMDPSPQKT